MIRVFEAFAGYGGWSFALKRLPINHATVGYSEIDKFAIQCYEQNHTEYWEDVGDESDNYGFDECPTNYDDITKINPEELHDFDLLCASPPCQAFSIAGKGQGANDEKGRGRLFEDTIEIMRIKQPKYAVYENVKGLTTKKHQEYFSYIQNLMRQAGYRVFWKILNTKDFGVPQNRERVFIVCIRNDIDSSYFRFPEPETLTVFLKDILEDEVNEKYYLKPERVEKLFANGNMNCNPSGRGMNGKVHTGDVSPSLTTNKGEGHKFAVPVLTPERMNKRQNGRRFKTDGEPMFTLNTQDRHGILCVNTKNLDGKQPPQQDRIYCADGVMVALTSELSGRNNILQINNPKHSNDRVYAQEGGSPALNTMQGGNRQPFIISSTQKNNTIRNDGLSNCLPSAMGLGGGHTPMVEDIKKDNLTIRKLTPWECFRLQGFKPGEINLEGLSATQQYKLAGNGVTIDVCEKLLRNLLINTST